MNCETFSSIFSKPYMCWNLVDTLQMAVPAILVYAILCYLYFKK